jgi:PKD repeat protein
VFTPAKKRHILPPLVAVAALALAIAGISVPAAASAASVAPPTSPATVAADVLPTPQINGVVWGVVVVGNTAYAAGSFTKARPAGVAAGGAGEVVRNNAMAFDITTGAILPFNPNLNAQARTVQVSPDQGTVYFGGDFTTVNGAARSKIAAFNASTGAFIPAFAPTIAGQVVGIAITSDTVYAGGSFASANGVARMNTAAFLRTNGSITAWAPQTPDIVEAVAASDDSRVVVGGRFQTLNGSPIVGVGATDGHTGATLPFSTPIVPAQQGSNRSWVTYMVLKDGVLYGADDGEGGHWFDGRWAVDFATGNLIWLDNCYGASYGLALMGQVDYSVGHAHDCTSVNTFPDGNPGEWHRAIAETTFATGTDQTPPSSNSLISNQPIPTQLGWYPIVNTGTYTGQSQGGWSLGSNSNYLVMGGEFTTVNGKTQQGLAVFASKAIAPDKIGPVYTTALTPTVTSFAGGTARVAWTGTNDADDPTLTYQVLRDSSTTPVYTTSAYSPFWAPPALGFIDTGLTPGSSHTYKVKVLDSYGNNTLGPKSAAVTISNAAVSAYSQTVIADGANLYYPLDEASGTTVYDHAGFADGVAGSDVTRNVAGAIPGDSASSFPGTATGIVATKTPIDGPNVFTIEAWVKTTSTTGGKIVGFGSANTGDSGSYDRHIYMDGSGRVTFGVYPGGVQTVQSAPGLNDGNWHLITASLGSGGMALYVDGARVARNTSVTSAQAYSGYWRIGGDNINGWPNTGSNEDFVGSIDDVAIYPTALATSTVVSHYNASGRTANVPTAPTDAYGQAVYQDNPDIFWRLDDTSGTTAADASQNPNPGVITGGVTKGQPGAINQGTSWAFNGSDAEVAATNSVSSPGAFSEEAWFKTTTNQGGKLMGFGDQNSGLSSNYDRHVYMQNDGTLAFGTWTGQTNLAISQQSYNDGQWHQAVATQGPDGLTLYVDGVAVATNPQTSAQAYTGYWRIGGDNTWNSSSPYFAGTLDEASFYSTELSPARVLAHFKAGGGTVANQPPTAAFSSTVSGATATFDATGSSDSDGTVASYAWDFGDLANGTGSSPSHTYTTSGTYNVVLTVTDNSGATNQVTHQVNVTVPPPNQAPTAAFASTVTGASVAFDSAGSSDSDGTIASYAWDFGDGSSGSGASPSHTYSTTGTYQVKLTVTDNDGATGTITNPVSVTVPVNQPPTASFTATPTGASVAFDATASSDSDGAIASYSWDFGDSSSGSGSKPSHTYTVTGTYNVQLIVTDNSGATNQVSHSVTVTVPPVDNSFAKDAFGRTVANGFGTADKGGAWSLSGTASNFAVNNGVGKITMPAPASGSTAYLNSVSSSSTDLTVDVSIDKVPTGSGSYASVIGRSISGVGDYRAKVTFKANGTVSIALLHQLPDGSSTVFGTETVVAGLTYTAGVPLSVHLQVFGTSPTTIRANVWTAGTTEPTGWQKSTTDTTAALQAPGRIGLYSYLSTSATESPRVMSWDNLRAAPVAV